MSHVFTEIENGFGVITLNRPETLNAIDVGMVRLIAVALENWRDHPDVEAVVFRSAVPRAFCAGGDVKLIRSLSIGRRYRECETFFSEEYDLNAKLNDYTKPRVSLINGLCMGGGVGLSIYGDYRVVCANSRISMPETRIGFFPDVGGSWFLPRMRGGVGMYLALSGRSLVGRDAAYAGFATHYVDAGVFDGLFPRLIAAGPAKLHAVLGEPLSCAAADLANHRMLIDDVFAEDSVQKILETLRRRGDEWATGVVGDIEKCSPTSLLTTFDLLSSTNELSLRDSLNRELVLTRTVIRDADFNEGVRAVLIDKETPAWNPASLAEARSLLPEAGL